MVIQPLVEGHGEVQALPVLLRRLQEVAVQFGFQINPPYRRNRDKLTTEASVRQSVRLAMVPDCAGILIVFDSDDDPACTIGPNVQRWAQAETGSIPCQVVAITREYEAWFISAVESLRGINGISPLASSHPTPEEVRDAKGALEGCMVSGSFYSPSVDQVTLTSHVDLAEVHRKCRSFRKMVKAFGVLAQAAGASIDRWPPESWV